MSIETDFRDFEDRFEILVRSYRQGEMFRKMLFGCEGEREKARQQYDRVRQYERQNARH